VKNVNERIKTLRIHLKLNQQDFADKIGIGKTAVSKIESSINNPSEQTIKLICSEFGVNEAWLRTGEGGEENIFTKISSEDRYSLNLGKLTKTENILIQNAINALAESEPEKLKIVEELMKKCLGIE